jgi:hypothetical protein
MASKVVLYAATVCLQLHVIDSLENENNSSAPTLQPTSQPTSLPSATPTALPTQVPTHFPTFYPTLAPSIPWAHEIGHLSNEVKATLVFVILVFGALMCIGG